MSRIITGKVGCYSYYEDLFRAQKSTGLYLLEEHDGYVARLLHEYSDCDNLMSVSTSILLLEGHYREAGDRSLLLSGLRATLKPQYKNIGTMAYGNLGKEPYNGLAGHFQRISKVLAVLFTKGSKDGKLTMQNGIISRGDS